MKQNITLLFIAFSIVLNAQFQDFFTDGNFTANPIWAGQTANFEVDVNNQLHLNAPAITDESQLVTSSQASVDGYWEFFVHLDFSPSTSNIAYVYIISDQNDLKSGLNGYFVKVGGASGSVDEVSLYKQTGTTKVEIIDGVDGTVAVNPIVKIKVTRDLIGNFELFIDTSATFNNPISQGIVYDNTFTSSNYFGFLCDYTGSRSDKFYFDSIDVTAQIYVDIFPPTLTNLEIVNANTLNVSYSESLNVPISQNVLNYSVDNGVGNPVSAVYNNVTNTVLLTFANDFSPNINYSLAVNNIEDLNSNVLNTTVSFTLENAYVFNSIIFNEFMADEIPSIGLPTYEFIEFKNLLDDTLFTDGWFLSDLTDTTYFNTDTILPYEFVLVGKTTSQAFYDGFGKAFGLTSFVSLNKSEDKLTLYNKYGSVIDSVHYYDDWFREEMSIINQPKVDGGWSLERLFDEFNCSEMGNWFPSKGVLGGTPGSENSLHNIAPENAPIPEIESAFFINDTTIQIIFSDEPSNALLEDIYEVSAVDFDLIVIHEILNIYSENNSYFIVIDKERNENYDYFLSINDVTNCYNESNDITNYPLYYVKTPKIGDLVINEILFNPYTGATDYIEIYNTTNFALNLNQLQFIEYDVDDEDTITDFSTTITEEFFIAPNSYFTFTEDTQSVYANYIVDNSKWLFELNIPNFADNEGVAAIVLNDTLILDKLHYFSRWNFELLDSDNGVSLERISAKGETQDSDNWASAAQGYGYGTPTALNSQTHPDASTQDLISISPEVFTPNQDGDKDFALISYTIDEPGYVATVAVFDVVGRKIKELAINETIGTEGFWRWDGTNNNQEKAKIGIYIVLVDLFDLNGNKKNFKEKVVLGSKF